MPSGFTHRLKREDARNFIRVTQMFKYEVSGINGGPVEDPEAGYERLHSIYSGGSLEEFVLTKKFRNHGKEGLKILGETVTITGQIQSLKELDYVLKIEPSVNSLPIELRDHLEEIKKEL